MLRQILSRHLNILRRHFTSNNLASSTNMSTCIHPNLRGVFVGSGSDGMSQPQVSETILKLLPDKKADSSINVLYVGTATYDLAAFRERQTQCFVEKGCTISSLDVALKDDPNAPNLIRGADIIIVSGGNTLYAVDRWNKLGLSQHFRSAMERGAVLTGGSAGAICWFDGGHSDSMDPDTYKNPMLKAFGEIECTGSDESSSLGQETKDWKYIRVNCLGLLPGLVCPHHDRVQSNGVLRAIDFDAMLLRHPGELGICIDHWAALCITGEEYFVLSLAGKTGSVVQDEMRKEPYFSPNDGLPGIWIKEVKDGQVTTTICPEKGKIKDLLRAATKILEDTNVDRCRSENPSS